MFKPLHHIIAFFKRTALLRLSFILLISTASAANVNEITPHQTPLLFLAEKTTLSGTENIKIPNIDVENHKSLLVLTNITAITNANQLYVTESVYPVITSFASLTKKGLHRAAAKNSKVIKSFAPNQYTTTPTTVQTKSYCPATPNFPFLPNAFFSIEKYLSTITTSTYVFPTKKAQVSSAYSLHHTSEKLLKAAIAYNSRQMVASISEQFCTYTFSLPPPFFG